MACPCVGGRAPLAARSPQPASLESTRWWEAVLCISICLSVASLQIPNRSVLLMRVIPALGLCKLRKVSQSRTHDALLRHRVRSRSALPAIAAHASGSLVHGARVPSAQTGVWGKPGRRDRHDQDSHVTSNTPPRSNTGSVMIGMRKAHVIVQAATVSYCICFCKCCVCCMCIVLYGKGQRSGGLSKRPKGGLGTSRGHPVPAPTPQGLWTGGGARGSQGPSGWPAT